jgi:protein PhnA
MHFMGKGYDKNQERKSDLSSFGKNLVRRSGSSCEMCGDHGVTLGIYELPPVPSTPDYDRCLFVCNECRDQLDNPRKLKVDHWRCLNNTVWSETAVIQALSIRLLKKIAKDHSWAEELLEQVFPDPEIAEMADSY